MLGKVAEPKAIATNGIMGGNLAYVDGGAGSDTITAAAGSFITQGFAPGDKIYTLGSTTAANNLVGVTLTGVVAGTLTFATGSINTAEVFAAGAVLVCCKGGSVKDIFKDGVLRIYSGSQPASADNAVAGTLLAEITENAAAFVAGAFGNGLEFGDAASGAISKAVAETWQALGLAAGSAGWFRLVANATDSGAASTASGCTSG